MFLLNSLQYKNYSLWSSLSKYVSIKRYFFWTGSKKEKKKKIRKCQLRLVGCFSLSCLMMFNMYSNVSLDTRKHFFIIPIIIPFNPPRFISCFTFSSFFAFLYLSQGSSSWYNNINKFFYIIFIHLPFLTPYLIHFIYILFTLFLHFLKKFLKSFILFLRQLK